MGLKNGLPIAPETIQFLPIGKTLGSRKERISREDEDLARRDIDHTDAATDARQALPLDGPVCLGRQRRPDALIARVLPATLENERKSSLSRLAQVARSISSQNAASATRSRR